MDKLPPLIDSVRLPLELAVPAYLSDHQVGGRAVLPAVEAMQVLAQAVSAYRPDIDVAAMTVGRFDKFLDLAPGCRKVEALVDLLTYENGDLAAALCTRRRGKTAAIARLIEHAALVYRREKSEIAPPPIDLAAALEGVCLAVAPRKIYRELVPFGPAFQNIRETLWVSEDGALAAIVAPGGDELPQRSLLGSPFVLDAAYHAACVWGQRYALTIPFPVGFEQRRVLAATRPGRRYFARIVPVRIGSGAVTVDIFIYDEQGRLQEYSLGVRMRDISGGKLQPPRWIMSGHGASPLAGIAGQCRAVAVIELKTLAPFAHKALSDPERRRFEQMGARRRPSFLAARLACKRIARKLAGNDRHWPARDITTVAADGVRPACPHKKPAGELCCSVSHDSRFAIAVAGDRRLGVDVEPVSERALAVGHLYMSAAEQACVKRSKLGADAAAIRVWTSKEAVAKALDVNLADAWQRVEVHAIGSEKSRLRIDGRPAPDVTHEVVGRHVFSVFRIAEGEA